MASNIAQLGISWQSMLLYFVNFGVLFFVLKHFLGKKVLVLLDERRAKIHESIEAAEMLKKEVAEERAKVDQEMKALRTELAHEAVTLRKGLEEERAQAIAEVEAFRAKAIAQAEQDAKHMREKLFADMQGEMRKAVEEMLVRMLGREEATERMRKTSSV